MEKKIPDYSQLERGQVPVEYTWKIEDIYASEADWQADKETVTADIAGIDATDQGLDGVPRRHAGAARPHQRHPAEGRPADVLRQPPVQHRHGQHTLPGHGRRAAQPLRGPGLQALLPSARCPGPGRGEIRRLSPGRAGAGPLSFPRGKHPARQGPRSPRRPAAHRHVDRPVQRHSRARRRHLNDVEVPPAEITLGDGRKAVNSIFPPICACARRRTPPTAP